MTCQGGLILPGHPTQGDRQASNARLQRGQRTGLGHPRLAGAPVGVSPEYLRKQGVALHRGITHQADAGHRPGVGRLRAVDAVGKRRHLGTAAALSRCQVQQLG